MAAEVSEDRVDLVAKQITVTKLLASNDPKIRSDGIKQMKQLLLSNSGDSSNALQLDDYKIIWRGLFYFMWMSDKPLPQEMATEKISNLFHSCSSYQGKILFLEAFFLTIKDDWMSISQHRIDKFMMLVRRCLRQVLFTFVNCDWDLQYLEKFSEVLYRALKSFTLSLRSHLQEIFLEELAKVSKGNVPSEALVIILDAFLHYISELNDHVLIKEVIQNVFRNLLTQSPDLEMLEAKFEAWRKMGKPGKSYNDLELVEAELGDDDSNQHNNGPLDPRAGNVSVEIPRIKFNPKDVSRILNKYVTEVDCSRKCLVEITKLIKWYNRLGEGVLPYKPKQLKLNSDVLKRKKKKYLSKLVKEGVKKLEMVDSKIKKSGREVIDNHKSLKKLENMGEIIVEHGKVGKSVWKVRKFDEGSVLKENLNLNGSWTVSDETKNNTVTVTDDKPPLLVPVGFNVEVADASEKISSPIEKPSSTSLKSLMGNASPKESNLNKSLSPKSLVTDVLKNNSAQKLKSPSIKDSSPLGGSANLSGSKKTKKSIESGIAKTRISTSSVLKNSTPNKANDTNIINEQNTADNQKSSDKKSKLGKTGSSVTQSKSPKANDISFVEQNINEDLVISKIKRRSEKINDSSSSLNESWSVCTDNKLNSTKRKSPKSKIADESILTKSKDVVNTSQNNSWTVSSDNDKSASKKVKTNNESNIIEKRNSLTSAITPDKGSKSPKSPTPEQRVLRRRTIIIPKKKPEGQDESTPKRKSKVSTETKVSQKRRKTIAGEEIGLLKPEEISNKALEKVRSEGYEDDFSSPRKSSRLSIRTDSAKKRVEFQLKNNIAQEFMEYTTTLVTNPENPHDASKKPVQGVLKSTPDTNRINPFYKFHERSAKKNSRKSII